MLTLPRAFDGDESTTKVATPMEFQCLRPEIWTTAKKDFQAGDFDKAIFASFISEEAQFVKRVPKARLAVAGA